MPAISVSGVVTAALAAGRPVVALESTVFSRLGLPDPAGTEALERACRAVEGAGAVPALTGVVGGAVHAGVDEDGRVAVVVRRGEEGGVTRGEQGHLLVVVAHEDEPALRLGAEAGETLSGDLSDGDRNQVDSSTSGSAQPMATTSSQVSQGVVASAPGRMVPSPDAR